MPADFADLVRQAERRALDAEAGARVAREAASSAAFTAERALARLERAEKVLAVCRVVARDADVEDPTDGYLARDRVIAAIEEHDRATEDATA